MPSPFEFPSDNPDLFTARPPAVSERRLTESPGVAGGERASTAPPTIPAPESLDEWERILSEAPAGASDDIEIVDTFDEAEFRTPNTEPNPVGAFVRALGDVARDAGAQERKISLLAGLLGFERLRLEGTDASTLDELVAAGLLAKGESGYTRSDEVVGIATAWCVALMGEDPDFSACSGKMLDEWSAEIVAKLSGGVGAIGRVEVFRRALRARGIAAFGVLIDAA